MVSPSTLAWAMKRLRWPLGFKQTFSSACQYCKKPLDSSARNLLIYIEVTSEPSGLRPVLGWAGRRENVQTESKTCRLLAEMALSAVRRNPRKHAEVGKKKPTPRGWFFLYWWWVRTQVQFRASNGPGSRGG